MSKTNGARRARNTERATTNNHLSKFQLNTNISSDSVVVRVCATMSSLSDVRRKHLSDHGSNPK